jgi:hypothetical protein
MAQSGNWIPNLFNWFIGYIFMFIWMYVGMFFGIFGLWQIGLDGTMDVYKNFAPSDVSSAYEGAMSVGGQ